MSEHQWTCSFCGKVNTGVRFCVECGALETAVKIGTSNQPVPKQYTSWKDAVKETTDFGELISLTVRSSSSGMAIDSYCANVRKLTRDHEEPVIFEEETKGSFCRIKRKYRADDAALEDAEKLIRKENLPAWERIEIAEDERYIMMDYSSSSAVEMEFRNPSGSYPPTLRFTLDWKVFRAQKRGDIAEKLNEIFRLNTVPERLIEETSTDLKRPEGPLPFVQTEENTWVCPMCGYTGNTGKFCTECGSKKPE